MQSVNDLQLSGLVDIIVAQNKDIVDLYSFVLALVQLGEDLGAKDAAGKEELGRRFVEYKAAADALPPLVQIRERIQVLEAFSIQLKQSGEPIQ